MNLYEIKDVRTGQLLDPGRIHEFAGGSRQIKV